MTKQEVQTFIEIVEQYFQHISGESATMGLPFIKSEKQSEILDFTGLIGVSGPRKGGIYVTTGKELLQDLTKYILDEEETDEELLLDMVGEMTNTISGNVRKEFGSEFMISAPMMVRGAAEDIVLKLKPPVFVIPMTWKGHKAYLSVGLD
jgi:chemotaxis protein CheX